MRRKSINAILACSLAVSLAACTDVWDEHYQSNPALNGNENLWELIASDPELDDFATLLQATGYDTLLTKNRSYTVWAPTDMSSVFDVASLSSASDSMLSVYRKEIVENHIADYSHVAGGIRDKEDKKNYQRVTVLNGKRYHFEGSVGRDYIFAGSRLGTPNILAKNGVLHKLDKGVLFAANIWEQLPKEESLDSLWKFLSKDYIREFNEAASVKGPIVDGQQTYLDSVFTESCRWFWQIGQINNEDSSYTMYALTNSAWTEMYNKVRPYFNYPPLNATEELGGMPLSKVGDSIVKEIMCNNLVFSNTVNQKYFQGERDTLISTRYNMFVNKSDDRAADSLHFGCLKELELSNGTIHIIDQMNYKPTVWGHDTIHIEGESLYNSSDIKGYENAYKTVISIDRDHPLYGRISGNQAAVYEPNPATALPTLRFYFSGILSAHYKVGIVLVPPYLLDDSKFKQDSKKNKFNAVLKQRGGDKADSEVGTTIASNKLSSTTEDIDTIWLSDSFKFNYCEAHSSLTGLKSMTSLEISTAKLLAPTKTYGVDKVLLVPVE